MQLLEIKKKSENEINKKKIQDNINIINEFTENNKGKNIQIMIVPTASLILKDKLPQNAQEYNQNAVIDRIKDSIKNAIFIDLREQLLSHKDEYIYYKTEYSKILNNSIENDKIEIFKLAEEFNYEVSYNFNKAKSSSVYDFDKLKVKDKYEVFLGGNYPELKIKTDNKNKKNILIIKDSYANSFIPFLLSNYENIYVLDMRYFKENLNKYMNKNKIEEVLILYNVSNFVT